MNEDDFDLAIKNVLRAESDNFAVLSRMAGLNQFTDFRYANLSGVDFSNSDLRDFDFTGALLLNCQFHNALIEGAIFSGAKLAKAELKVARDYKSYIRKNDLKAQNTFRLAKPYISSWRYEFV